VEDDDLLAFKKDISMRAGEMVVVLTMAANVEQYKLLFP